MLWHTHPNALHDRYNNAILHYMFFEQYCKGGKLKYCEVCGKLILVKGKASTKYCDKCKREKELENTRLRVNKHRNERQV